MIDLGQAYDEGCEAALEETQSFLDELVEAGHEKIAGAVAEKLKKAGGAVKNYHKGMAGNFRKAFQGKHRTNRLGFKVKRPKSETGLKTRAKEFGKGVAKLTPHAAVGGAAGYGAYRAKNKDD